MKYKFYPKDVDLFVIATDSSVPSAHRFCTNTSNKHLLVQLQGFYFPMKSHMPALQWFLFCQNSYIPSSHYNSLLKTCAHAHACRHNTHMPQWLFQLKVPNISTIFQQNCTNGQVHHNNTLSWANFCYILSSPTVIKQSG